MFFVCFFVFLVVNSLKDLFRDGNIRSLSSFLLAQIDGGWGAQPKNSTKSIRFEAECSIYVPKGVCMISRAPKPLWLVASQQTVLIQKCYDVTVSLHKAVLHK